VCIVVAAKEKLKHILASVLLEQCAVEKSSLTAPGLAIQDIKNTKILMGRKWAWLILTQMLLPHHFLFPLSLAILSICH
jgi:hypothetical protein